jgi:hypothetical protein
MPAATGRPGRRALVTWIDLASLLSAILLATVVYVDLSNPRVTHSSDYVSSFYVAGKLTMAGELERLYSPPEAVSFRKAPFDEYAHDILPGLREQTTTAFLYPPVAAWIFAPLSVLPPHVSLLMWQIVSIAALALACLLMSWTSGTPARHLLLLSAFFFPVFMTVAIGQAGLVFGLLPLTAGYWLLHRGSPLAAGLAWAALSLKPPFLIAAGLMSMAYAVIGQARLLAGLILGLVLWVALNYFLAAEGLLAAWLRSLHLSDAIFSSGEYLVPVHLVTSIPADVMMRFSPGARGSLKVVLYALSAALGLFALWQCRTILRSRLPPGQARLAVFATCLAILPLTSPHLLYYDLVTLFPMALIVLNSEWREPPLAGLRRTVLVSWAAIGAYMVVITFIGYSPASSLIVLVILLATWARFLQQAVRVSALAIEHAAGRR